MYNKFSICKPNQCRSLETKQKSFTVYHFSRNDVDPIHIDICEMVNCGYSVVYAKI